MKTFNIGDRVWIPEYGMKQIEIPCPVCSGKMQVTVILGDGTEVIVSCSYCGDIMGPSGKSHEWEWSEGARSVIIEGVEIQQTKDEEKREYHYNVTKNSWNTIPEGEAFETEVEAKEKSKEHMERRKQEKIKRAEYVKQDKTKSFSWNAGYHLREAKRLRTQVEYHDRMAVICKARDRAKTSE